MAACPKCGSRKVAASKNFQALAEPATEGAFAATPRVSVVECGKCGAEFPTIESKKKYLLAPAVELEKVRKAVEALKEENEAMNARLKEISVRDVEIRLSIEKIKKEGEVKILESRHEALLANVSYLRSEKERLERLYSSLSLAAPLVTSTNRNRKNT